MDIDDFIKTKYAKQLLSDADSIETELGEFNARWAKFWQRNADHLGTVLIGHLIVEHYINDWLAAANPGINAVSGTRLSFAQKVELLDGADPSVQWLLPGVIRLNRIRNQLVHDLEAQISDRDLEPIRDIVWPWHAASGKPRNSGVALLKDFALLVSGMLSSQASIGRFIEAEVLYRHVPEFNTSGQLHQSRERADLVIATVVRSDRATPYQMGEVEAVLEVKHNRSRKPLVWDDIDFLGKRRATSKAVRSFLIYTAVNERPNEFTDDYGAAILPRNRKTPNDTAYRVRRVRRATQRIPSKNKLAIGHYANLIEVSPSS